MLALGRVSNYNLQKNINESPMCFWHTLMHHCSFRGLVQWKITHGESRAATATSLSFNFKDATALCYGSERGRSECGKNKVHAGSTLRLLPVKGVCCYFLKTF